MKNKKTFLFGLICLSAFAFFISKEAKADYAATLVPGWTVPVYNNVTITQQTGAIVVSGGVIGYASKDIFSGSVPLWGNSTNVARNAGIKLSLTTWNGGGSGSLSCTKVVPPLAANESSAYIGAHVSTVPTSIATSALQRQAWGISSSNPPQLSPICIKDTVYVSPVSVPNTYTCLPGDILSGTSCLQKINGSCGSSNGQTIATAPTSGFCSSGSYSVISGSGPWTWSCLGSNGGSTAACSAQKTAPPPIYDCGISPTICSDYYSFANEVFKSYDPSCTPGTEIPGTITYPINCSCGVQLCYLPGYASTCFPPTSGVCGSDNGLNFSSPAQPTNLCSAGNQNLFTSTSSGWTWSCDGQNGGSTASCLAMKITPFNGQCGTDNAKELSSNPTNLCTVGSPSIVNGSGPWDWTCAGIDGGSSVNCSAQKAPTSKRRWRETAP